MAVAAPSPTPVQEDFRSAYADLQPSEEDFKAAYSDLAEPDQADFKAAYADLSPDAAVPESARALQESVPETNIGPYSVAAEQPQWVHNAAEAAKETGLEFIPRSVGDVAHMLDPRQTIPNVGGQIIGTISDWVQGKPIEEAAANNFPTEAAFIHAMQTPPLSKDRFKYYFQEAAKAGMYASVLRGGGVRPKTGEPNAVQVGSAEAQIPRPIETGEVKPADSGGMGQEQPRIEVAGPQDEVPPATETTGAAVAQFVPGNLSGASRVGSEIHLSFDALENPPTAEAIKSAFEARGHKVAVIPLQTGFVSAVRGQKNFKVDVFGERGPSESSAQTVMNDMLGEDAQFRGKTKIESVPLEQRFSAVRDFAAEKQSEITQAESAILDPTATAGEVKPKTYEEAQQRIDQIENRLEADGVNVIHLYDPSERGTEVLVGHEDWKPMPSELAQAYKDREAIGSTELQQNISDISYKLKSKGLSNSEVARVLDYYALNLKDTGAISQYMAAEHTQKLAKQPPTQQAESVAIALAAERGEMFDELKDISPKTLRDAAQAVKSVRDYFSGAGPIGKTESLDLPAARPPPAEPAAGAVEEPPQTPTGLKNSIVDQDRIKMGLPERMKPARATNQTAWDAAMARVDKNPVAGTELVKELKGKPRALNPEDTALLLHEKLTRETNFDRAVEDVNNAKNETDLTRAKSDLAIARDAFHEIADVSQNQAGRESGLSLQARKMLVNRDFSLARMEAEERASANDGKPLSESQLADVKAAHEKIAELEAKIREHESEAQNQELKRYFDKLLKEAKPKAGGRVVDFLHEQRDKARAREKARVGRLSAGIDPAQLADQVIIGASHIADGLIEIGAWSTKMLSDFGETIRPFLKDIFDKSRALHDAAAKKFQGKEKKSPATKEESTLKRVKTGYINRTRELQGKIASDQLERPIRTKTQLDHEGEKLKGEYERLKEHWLTRQAANEAKNKTASQKFWDHFVGVQRAMKLSSDAVLAKLTLAAVAREAVLTPAEEAVGGVLSKAMPRLAKRAPREGGFSLNAEVKAKVDTFTKGMRDSWQNLKMQKSDLEAIYGKKEFTPQQWYQYFGYLHGALKAPVKRAEFTRSMAKRMKWAIQEGKDINNPNVIGELAQEAYVDANRSIFMQNNIISTAISAGLKAAERSKIAPNIGPGIARLGNFLMPIIKVPTNIVGEVATGVHGVVTGSLRAGFAYLKGIESLPIEQGDAIMRQLKKGAIGNALLLTGYFGYESIGGFYHQGDKRSDNDVPAGRFRVGDVDLPKSASHSTGAMLLEIGATVHRIQDERLHKGDSGAVATGKGVLVAGQGLTHELPFVPAVTGISDAIGTQYGFEKYINSMITGSTSPAIVSHVARVIDTPGSFPKNILVEPTKRKPTNVWQSLEMGFPGLRQRVPEKSNGAKISGSPFKGSSMRGSKQP